MTLFKKCQTFFHQTSMGFHSAMATLESQKYASAGTVGMENIISGRLVPNAPTKNENVLLKKSMIEVEEHLSGI